MKKKKINFIIDKINFGADGNYNHVATMEFTFNKMCFFVIN